MACWYYEKRQLRHTPSISAGITYEQETQFRREGARFILSIGNKMGLRYETMATGVVYFHRFYMVHTFQEFPRHVTACCCLFLAGKVEETPKKCRDIMKVAKSLIDEATWAEFGPDPREEVMTLERILLQTIKFDFIVNQPYSYLLMYAKSLKGDKKKLHNMVQMAWTFVNDSLCTTLCLQWEPEIIAIALLYLASKLSKFEVTGWVGKTSRQLRWWDMYVEGISMDLLEDVCHQVLDLYSTSRPEAMPLGAHEAMVGSRPPTEALPAASSAPPPAKKPKKEEPVSAPPMTPSKVAPSNPVQPVSAAYPYSYVPPYGAYPTPYAAPQTAAAAATAVQPPTQPPPPMRYPSYSFPPAAQATPAVSPAIAPPPYPKHYPSVPPTNAAPATPSHYATQQPLTPQHYPPTHPIPYHSSHYPSPSSNQQPPTTPHYPHHTPSSSYYHPPPPSGNATHPYPPPNSYQFSRQYYGSS